MNRPTTIALLVLASSAAGCPAREQATLCVVSPIPAAAVSNGQWDLTKLGCDTDTTGQTGDKLESCHAVAIADKQTYVVVHRLPAGVTPVGKLHVHVETPCSSTDEDIDTAYENGALVLTGVIPPGGRCAFSLTTTMANSTLGCDFESSDASCSAPATTCPSE